MRTTAVIKEILRGKDVYRLLMNTECEKHLIKGEVLDIGSGKNLASYHRFLQRDSNARVEGLDLMFDPAENGGIPIDLESDRLPREDGSVQTVLAFNVLEHIYNHNHVMQEMHRVLSAGGELIGVVPFLVGYHADPHDFWRYTHETLKKILVDAGFSEVNITPLAKGPFTAGYSQYEWVFPTWLKLIKVPIVFGLDAVVQKLKPELPKEKFALGLFFSAKK